MMKEGSRSLHGGGRQCVLQLESVEFLRQRRRRRVLGRAQPVVTGRAVGRRRRGGTGPRRSPGVLPAASARLDLDDRRLGRLGEAHLALEGGPGAVVQAARRTRDRAAGRQAVAARQRVGQ